MSKGGKILNVLYLTYLMVFNIVYINSTHKGMVCTSKSVRDTVVYERALVKIKSRTLPLTLTETSFNEKNTDFK